MGDGAWLDSPADLAPFLSDFRGLYHGATPLVLLPRNVDEVAGILSICNREETALVPHAGNTSYCGAATPDESGSQVVVSMRRLNRVRQLDAANYSMIVEAGCTLAAAQNAARDVDRLFPLSLELGGYCADRRQSLHQCRRHRGSALWNDARSGAGTRGGAGGRARPQGTQESAQGQYWIRREIVVCGRRGNLGAHHGSFPEALPA